MKELSGDCREMNALGKRIKRSYGADKISDEDFVRTRAVHNAFGILMDYTGNKELILDVEPVILDADILALNTASNIFATVAQELAVTKEQAHAAPT